jgi:hypothetical protein
MDEILDKIKEIKDMVQESLRIYDEIDDLAAAKIISICDQILIDHQIKTRLEKDEISQNL